MNRPGGDLAVPLNITFWQLIALFKGCQWVRKQWNAGGTPRRYDQLVPSERLLASYIVRVVVRAGKRIIRLHHMRTGETHTFASYRELLEHLGRSEEVAAQGGPELPPAGSKEQP